MKLVHRNFIVITILFIALFFAIMGSVDFTEDDNFPDYSSLPPRDFIAFWTGKSDHQLLSGLMLGMSIFALFVKYWRDRSNQVFIEARHIDVVNVVQNVLSVTAPVRAVFVFVHRPALAKNIDA